MGLRYLALVLILLSIPLPVDAEELQIPLIDQPLSLDDFAGMKPREGLDGKLARVDGFRQSFPKNGEPATQETVVYLAYDKDHLYVIFLCYDREPNKVRASITRRENISEDEDWVEIYVDTYNDQRRAYLFSTNALGIQWDARYSEEEEEFQPSFDALWDSEGKLTDQGYAVSMTIPFRSIRFKPVPDQEWRVILGRFIPRTNEYSSWPHISEEIKGKLNQSSLMTGLHNISPGKNIQFIPYATFRSSRFLDESDGMRPPEFVTDRADGTAGLDAKIVLKDNFVFDAAMNPDFSQVESDEPQVTVNERFEVFFPEKRPFFLENAQFFESPMDLVFTRRIADPQWGGRITGKYGPYTVGALVTNDEAPGKIAPEDDPGAGKDALFGIVRLSRDIFSQSSIGMLLTTRSFENNSNTVVGADSSFRLGENWGANAQAAFSRTTESENDSVTGTAFQASVARSGRQFKCELEYSDISPDFITLAGFIPRTDIRGATGTAQYYFRPEGNFLIAWGPALEIESIWDHDGLRLDSTYHPLLHFEMTGLTFLNLHYFYQEERLRPIDFPDLPQNTNFTNPTAQVNFNTSYWSRMTVRAEYAWGRSVNFEPPPGQLPSSADLKSASLSLNFRPLRSVQNRNQYLYTSLAELKTGASIFQDHIFRTRWDWQWNRYISIRVILQYESTIPDPDLSSLEDRRNLNADFLFTYLVNPWTALYIGYNGNRQNLELLENEPYLGRTHGKFLNDANLFFMKFSYLIRF